MIVDTMSSTWATSSPGPFVIRLRPSMTKGPENEVATWVPEPRRGGGQGTGHQKYAVENQLKPFPVFC